MKKFIIVAVVLWVLVIIGGFLTKPKKVAGPIPDSGVSTLPRSRAAP